ncbi:Ger(x)C family spore germination protein [Clostridium sp. DJ247]|uniref:Ger(x)C family spore germination protein n=1 Tax=Clostridium sp. DJ247 TaxID=2726188 RepID=UPI001624F629|nr:Ger(x)C family spore germination protein [Clostridium sp. DJ247]MBC2579480.1 Ger(x)C family spore germination protein [Clostridium sp. DJ247]
MKKLCLCFVILSSILFNGCFNYIDIDKVIFATAVVVDIDEQNFPIVYVEAYKAARGGQGSSGKGVRVLFKGTGKTLFEILRDLNLSSSYRINYTQVKGVIFTQKAAEKGLDRFIDIFDRDQEFVLRSQVVVYRGDPSALLGVKLKGQDYIGLFIHDLIYNISSSSRGVITTLNDFLNKNYTKYNAIAVPMVVIKKEQVENKIELDSAAIIKDYKMVGQLERADEEAYNFLVNKVYGGSMEVSNPISIDDFISLEILKNRTETRVYYDGKTIHIKKIINTKTSITEVQKKLKLSKQSLESLQRNAESNIVKLCSMLYDEYKSQGIDAFNLTEDFHRKYPKENIDNVIARSELEIEAHVIIETSTDISDFR